MKCHQIFDGIIAVIADEIKLTWTTSKTFEYVHHAGVKLHAILGDKSKSTIRTNDAYLKFRNTRKHTHIRHLPFNTSLVILGHSDVSGCVYKIKCILVLLGFLLCWNEHCLTFISQANRHFLHDICVKWWQNMNSKNCFISVYN